MMKKLFLLVLWAAFSTNVFGQSAKMALVNDLLERRNSILSDFNDSNQKDFFSNECSLLQALGPALGETKDKATKAKLNEEVKMCYDNIYVGATQYISSDPAFSSQLLATYFQVSESKAYGGAKLTPNPDAAFVYAAALQSTDGDQASVARYFDKALVSSHGASACQQLVALCHDKGDKGGEEKYLRYGYDHFPAQSSFGMNLLQFYFEAQKYNEVVKHADNLIQRINNGADISKDLIWHPYYYKATALFNSAKYEQAYDAYIVGDAVCPGHAEMVINAGNAAFKQAVLHADDADLARSWYLKAVDVLTKAQKAFPKESKKWGYPLWASYHNLGDVKMEKKYKKYAK